MNVKYWMKCLGSALILKWFTEQLQLSVEDRQTIFDKKTVAPVKNTKQAWEKFEN